MYNIPQTIYLVGDIIGAWQLKTFSWLAAHSDIVWRIFKRIKRRTRIVYIPGNHDKTFLQFTGLSFGESRSAARHSTTRPMSAG